MTRLATVAAVVAALPLAAAAQAVTKDAAPAGSAATGAGITAADLRHRVFLFAHDSMNGRAAGTVDNLRGADYVARELRRLGLAPAGDGGTYFQDVPLVRRALGDASITVGGATYAAGRDFLVRDNGPAQRAIDGAQAVYGGTWGDTTTWIAPDAAAGKLVIIGVPRGWQANRPLLSARFASAAAVAVASFDAIPPEIRAALAEPSVAMQEPDAAATPVPAFLYVSKALATALLGTPVDGAATGAVGQTARGTARFRVERVPARNVVAILPGSDPALRGQYVAIGAHNDHDPVTHDPVDHDSLRAVLTVTRPMGADDPERPATADEQRRIRAIIDSVRRARPARRDSIMNGADDDASGSMAMLEIAESVAAMATKPKRSLLFVWHTAEELGLLGAAWFTDHPTVPRDSIVAQLNLDMIGRGGAGDVPNGGPAYIQLIGSRRLSTELGDLVETVNRDTRAGFAFDYQFDANGHPEQYYCRSDHYMYARYGIPVTFFSTGGHRDYHQVTDEPQYLDYPKLARVTTLVRDVALRVANLGHRVVVDKPKPDPRGQCVQ